MKDFLKRIVALVLSVAMVLTGLPAMGISGATEVSAADTLGDFDPDLAFYHVKASSYPVANMSDYIYYVVADGNQSFKDRTQGTVVAYGTIKFNENKQYCRFKDGSWYIDLTQAIPDLVGWINGTKDGHKYKLFYGLFNGSGEQWFEKMQPTETLYDNGEPVKGCENKNTPEFRSAGVHATASDYSDIKCVCQLESGAEGGLVIENIAVELHTVNFNNQTCLYQTYYTKVHWDPVVYADDPEWVWEKGSTEEYLDSATATFKTDKKREDGSSYDIVVKDENIESYKEDVKTVFKAEADFTGTDVETKASLTNGKATSTKTFDQPVVNCDEAIQAGKTQNSAPYVSATFWRSGLTPSKNVDPGWTDSTVEHYNRPATAVVQNDNETKAHLYGQTTQAFGASAAGTQTVKRTYDVDWQWAMDGSTTATVTFTNASDSHSPYTVSFSGSDITLEDNANGTGTYVANAWFGGTKFTGRSFEFAIDDELESFVWRWIPKDTNADGAADDFDCKFEVDVHNGIKVTHVGPFDATVDYDKFLTDKILDATYEYGGNLYKASDVGANLQFTGPNWVWDETKDNKYMEAEATFKETTGNVPDTIVTGQPAIKNDTFVIKSKTVSPAPDCAVTHTTPERQSDNSYKWTHTAHVKFCDKPFEDSKDETTIPDIEIDKTYSGSTGDFYQGWEWSDYNTKDRNFTAIAHLKSVIERWKVIQRANRVSEAQIERGLDNWPETDNDTVYGGVNDEKAYFEGQVTTKAGKDTLTFTSPKRKFVKDSETVINLPKNGNPSCTFKFKEVEGSAAEDGDADSSGWYSFKKNVQLPADTIEAVGAYETDSQDPTKFMQKYKATVVFAKSKTTPQIKIIFTQEDYKHGIDPNVETVWEWGAYDPQKDTYPVKYWIRSTLNQEILDGDTAGIPGLLKAEIKTDGDILLTAYDQDAISPKGYEVTPDTRTVEAPPDWKWSEGEATKNMMITATFKQTGNGTGWSGTQILFDSSNDPYSHIALVHDKPVPSVSDSGKGKYDWSHHATVTFCGLDFETGMRTEIVIPTPSVIPPPPTITPGPGVVTPTPLPDIDKIKKGYGGEDNWYWDTYDPKEQEIPAAAVVADWIDRWSSLDPNNTERNNLTPRVLTDDVTALAQNSTGVKSDGVKQNGSGGNKVFFQGEVVANRYNEKGKVVEQKLSSQEREFNCTNNVAWNKDKTDITFTFTETSAYKLKDTTIDTKVQLTASTMAAIDADHGGFVYGDYMPDDKNVGKLKRTVQAYVYFGHQQFWSSEATQDNIDPDSIEIAWKWNKYDRSKDQYTAEYEITALKKNEEGTIKRIVMPDLDGAGLNPVVAAAAKVAEDSGVLLTANLPSASAYAKICKEYDDLKKLVEKDKTQNAEGPSWVWETKDAEKKYLEATATFTDSLPSTIAPYTLTSDSPARLTITHDTPVFNNSTKKYEWQHNATVTFCKLQFNAPKKSGWEEKITPTPIAITPTPGGETDSKTKGSDNWYWDSYQEVEQEIPATVKVAYTIERWDKAKPASVTSAALKPDHVETDDETALQKESGVGGIDKDGYGNNKVVFQGEANTLLDNTKLKSGKRTFTNTDRSGWNKDVTECVFTFTESSTGYTLHETIKVTASATNEALGICGFEYGELVPDKGREGLFKRDIWAYVYFGHQKFYSTKGTQTGIPGDYEIDWNWHSYNPDEDCYKVDYRVYLLKEGDHTSQPTRVELVEERNTVTAVATVDKNQVTTLTASVPSSKKYSSSAQNPSVRKVEAPKWNWAADYSKAPATFAEDATAFAAEHARADWGETSHVKNPAKIEHGDYRVKSLDPELYERTHTAEVTFCKNKFNNATDQEIKPTFDEPKVTATPTPVPTTPEGSTPTPKPGEPTPTPKPGTYEKHTVSWTWDDYQERLNNTSDSSTPNKGNFEKATATLTDDQTGFFTKRLTSVGTKSGVGGITITTPATNSSPISFKAAVENVKSDGSKEALDDTLSFNYPKKADWSWSGVTSATVTFTENKGKTFGKEGKSTVAITTKDIEHVADLTQTVYTATAYFGTHPYTDELIVSTDYVVYLRWPSSWNTEQYDPDYKYNKRKNPFRVYCYVYDEKGNDNGTTLSDKNVTVKGELMDVVVKGRTGRFFNYPLAAGSFENPSVKFYNALGVELPTPDVQSIVGDKVENVGTKLTMTEKGDWLYYEAALETASAKNTWKKYLPEINGHALTVVDSGILGMDFYFDLPERYGSSGTLTISAREEEGSPSRFTYTSQGRRSDGRFCFSRDVLIARIANDIYVDMTYGSGPNTAHLTETYSVEKYLTTGIERADAKLPQYQKVAKVLRTINDYGWYAQRALNMDSGEDPLPVKKCYGAPALMSVSEATALLEPYKFVVEKQAGDVNEFKYPLACWEDVRINLYTYTKTKNVKVDLLEREPMPAGFEFEPTIKQSYQQKGERYLYSIMGIPLDAMDKWFRYKITTNGGESIVKVSALSHQYRNITDTTGEVSQDSKNLSLAIVNVWKELNAYFES